MKKFYPASKIPGDQAAVVVDGKAYLLSGVYHKHEDSEGMPYWLTSAYERDEPKNEYLVKWTQGFIKNFDDFEITPF